MSHPRKVWNKLVTAVQYRLVDRASYCTTLSLQLALKDAFMLNKSRATCAIDCPRGPVRNCLEGNSGVPKCPLWTNSFQKTSSYKGLKQHFFQYLQERLQRQVGGSLISGRKRSDVCDIFQLHQTKVANNKTRKQQMGLCVPHRNGNR